MNFRVKWTVKKSVKLPLPLAGHCMAEISSNEMIIAGGFSPSTNDYIADAYILNTDDLTWFTRPWMSHHFGPRMDGACISMLWNNQRVVLTAGGWNNSALHTSEMYLKDQQNWIQIGRNTSNEFIMPIEEGVRSTVMVELNKKAFMVGGVICEG